MRSTIIKKLEELELEHNTRILYACESGSRAWGFASPDSDYDVRFIYARKTEDYLSIANVRDVLELPINEVLDISGWDVRKALQLFLKSNAPLYEWLQSPIIYREDKNFKEELMSLASKYFSLKAGANHYLSMAVNIINTLGNDLGEEQVKLKKYFYALRPALACLWIITKREVPPMEFEKLRALVADNVLQTGIDELLQLKQVSGEKTFIEPKTDLYEWLQEITEKCKRQVALLPSERYATDELDGLFRKHIR
ncbi:nucleotidyltransferase domain-containing protein [Desertivirga xinjiangensis]|uniref:nucleotidyltransferase domain-containing protein n=1 Tax=Desertivirga xinjiangensis TaxID=539206 RepID=UPI00210A0236|nr:nucleotidyltransferase domain-containing protein [Pedobacter xinjiangensis]